MKFTYAILLAVGIAFLGECLFAQSNVVTPSNPIMKTNSTELATFGGGCFWCTEAVYQGVKGVKSVTSGYAGGHTPNPTYRQVCNGDTGHAEVIQIEFHPAEVSYDRLVELFWDAH